MKKKYKILIPLMVLIVLLAIPGSAMAKELYDDQIVAGFPFILSEDDVIEGNLIVFGSTASTEPGSLVEGDVVVFGGIVTLDGEVEGTVVGIGGVVNLNENAVVDGDLITLAAALNKDPAAEVYGNVVDTSVVPAFELVPQTFTFPTLPSFDPGFSSGVYTLSRVFWFLFRTLLWGALAALVVLILPKQTGEVSNTVTKQTLLSGGLGLVTIIIAPVVLLILLITCIFSPVSLIGGFVIAVAWIFGVVAIGYEIGRRIAKASERDWALPVLAGIGMIGLAFIVDGIVLLVPPVGILLRGLVGIVGLGAVLLTRFGTQAYPAEEEIAPAEELPPPSGYDETSGEPEELVEGEQAISEEPPEEEPDN